MVEFKVFFSLKFHGTGFYIKDINLYFLKPIFPNISSETYDHMPTAFIFCQI